MQREAVRSRSSALPALQHPSPAPGHPHPECHQNCATPTQEGALRLPSSSPFQIGGCKQRICWTKPQPPRVHYSCDSALPFTTQVLSRMLQPSGAATWEAGSGLHEEASYLLRNCLCGILTIWKEYGNETFSEIELLSR